MRVDWEFPLSKKERMRGAWKLIRYVYLIIILKKICFLGNIFMGMTNRYIYKRGKEIKMTETTMRFLEHLIATRLKEKLGEEALQRVDDKNKGLRPENNSIFEFIEPSELEKIYISSGEDMGLNSRSVRYLEALINLRENGYLSK